MIATPRQSLDAAAALARSAGIGVHVLGDAMEGESREVGKVHAALARYIARRGQPFATPCVLLSGGETTVTVTSAAAGSSGSGTRPGKGGRATEFLLGCAIALRGEPGVHVLAADTDGIDGSRGQRRRDRHAEHARACPGPGAGCAGAPGPPRRLQLLRAAGRPRETGPTFTNVNDFRAVLIV